MIEMDFPEVRRIIYKGGGGRQAEQQVVVMSELNITLSTSCHSPRLILLPL